MSGPALSLAFFDAQRQISASARSGATLIFEGRASDVLPAGPEITPDGGGWRVELDGTMSLSVRPLADVADLGEGLGVHFCQITGQCRGQKVDCLGTLGETTKPPAWDDLDAVRSVSALFDPGHAVLAVARRPRGVPGLGHEKVAGWVLDDGVPLVVEETRLSTVYDGDGRQRGAGFEIFVDGEDFPRRLSGVVTAGSSLALEGLDVHAAVFAWRMDELEGAGEYELWSRSLEPEAA